MAGPAAGDHGRYRRAALGSQDGAADRDLRGQRTDGPFRRRASGATRRRGGRARARCVQAVVPRRRRRAARSPVGSARRPSCHALEPTRPCSRSRPRRAASRNPRGRDLAHDVEQASAVSSAAAGPLTRTAARAQARGDTFASTPRPASPPGPGRRGGRSTIRRGRRPCSSTLNRCRRQHCTFGGRPRRHLPFLSAPRSSVEKLRGRATRWMPTAAASPAQRLRAAPRCHIAFHRPPTTAITICSTNPSSGHRCWPTFPSKPRFAEVADISCQTRLRQAPRP